MQAACVIICFPLLSTTTSCIYADVAFDVSPSTAVLILGLEDTTTMNCFVRASPILQFQ